MFYYFLSFWWLPTLSLSTKCLQGNHIIHISKDGEVSELCKMWSAAATFQTRTQSHADKDKVTGKEAEISRAKLFLHTAVWIWHWKPLWTTGRGSFVCFLPRFHWDISLFRKSSCTQIQVLRMLNLAQLMNKKGFYNVSSFLLFYKFSYLRSNGN